MPPKSNWKNKKAATGDKESPSPEPSTNEGPSSTPNEGTENAEKPQSSPTDVPPTEETLNTEENQVS